MQISDLTKLGKIIKAHGFNGAVMIVLEGDFGEEIMELESVFVAIDGLPVPFFIEECRDAGRESLIVKFAYYDSDYNIKEFIGCSIYSDLDLSGQIDDSELHLSYIGYSLIDSEGRLIGKIAKIMSYPMQIMLEIEKETKALPSVLIPYNEDWVIEVLSNERKLVMHLPEGLESINI
ncbi:MAG: ribosome maturation factor RimM [Bacteroidales bacterium]|nr:ribosome maturation factor RimM [Bacteroidales bacterium]